MTARIYLTHCSARKNRLLRNSTQGVTPDKLYTATPARRFMSRCKKAGAKWAIFSDLYGVWFPHIGHRWYEKSPDTVTDKDFKRLVSDFDRKLRGFDEIWFYRNPGRFHWLYKELLRRTRLRKRVRRFSHLSEIT